MITYEVLEQGERFYMLIGPFLVSRDVRRELGIPVSSDENYRWVVAMDDGEAVGFAAVELHGDAAQLRHAYVVPKRRGNGIYNAMIERREEIAREVGFDTVETVASPDSVNALSARGYEAVGSRGKYTILEKRL